MRKFIPQSFVSAHLLASDFPSENQTLSNPHYPYTNRWRAFQNRTDE